MALHRDIYWVGRQWAVTGFGVQAVDQRLQGAFDIKSSQVWDEGLQARTRAHAWVNAEDFDKALVMARQRFPEPERKSLPLVESVLELIQQPGLGPSRQPMPPPCNDFLVDQVLGDQVSGDQVSGDEVLDDETLDDETLVDDVVGLQLVETTASVERPQAELPPPLQFSMEGQLARFLPQWRVRR